jgi:hypothetical protein
VRHVHHEIAVEPLRGAQDHDVADDGAPVVSHQQDTIQPESVEKSQDAAGYVILRPLVRSGPGPAVAGQIGRDDAQPGRRIGQQIPILPMVLRPSVQRDDGASIGRTGLGHVKPHPAGVDE